MSTVPRTICVGHLPPTSLPCVSRHTPSSLFSINPPAPSSVVAAIYNRFSHHDEMREAMTLWETKLSELTAGDEWN